MVPSPLSTESSLNLLAAYLPDVLARQVTDPDRPDVGAVISDDTGLADARRTAELVTACAYLVVARPDDEALLEPAIAGLRYLCAARRPSGMIDLHGCNYDSAPDTGFVVQHLCTAVELLQSESWLADDFFAAAEDFVRGAARGMSVGGFHTPNHRWVVASALAQVQTLWPEDDYTDVIDAYRAEGIDIDADGAFLERSPAVYDAVTNRSLLFLHEMLDWPEAADAAARNLALNLHLLHGNATIETGLSRRYDFGSRTVPVQLIHTYLMAHARQGNPLFLATARRLWAASDMPFSGLLWVVYALMAYGEPVEDSVPLPESYSRWFPAVQIGRIRRGPLSVSVFGGQMRLLDAQFGGAYLASMTVQQSYFGPAGHFVVDDVQWGDGEIILRTTGDRHPRRPGYELPLGRPVAMEEWDASFDQRPQYRLPAAAATLTLREVADGFECHLVSEGSVPGVTSQIAFDFAPGGIWETASCALETRADQVLVLRDGLGAMRYGLDRITIGPGADAHRTWRLRDATSHAGLVRVIIPLLTPLDQRFSIRFSRGV
jgi:hypothetical protein